MFFLIRRGALLLLAFSVFGLGLHARLAVYTSSTSFNPTSAKISTEKNSARMLEVFEERDWTRHTADKLAVSFLLSEIHFQPALRSITELAEIALANPTLLDLNGINSLHRPPPSLL
jgi:hypothetical protein